MAWQVGEATRVRRRRPQRQGGSLPKAIPLVAGAATGLFLLLSPGPARAEDLTATPIAWVALLPSATLPAPPVPSLAATPEPESSGGFMAGRFLVGISTTRKLTPETNLGSTWSVAPFVRNTPRRTGWGPSFGLSWYTGDISVAINGQRTTIGEVKVRPVMAGIGYTVGHGRARTTLSVVGGYAFTRAKVTAVLPAGAEAAIGIRDSWVVRPNVGVTVALSRRLALVGSVAYVYTRPTITIDVTQPGQAPVRVSGSYRSDYVSLTVGTAFSIF